MSSSGCHYGPLTVFLVGGEPLPISTCAISRKAAASETAFPVKASSITVLSSGSETTVGYYVASNIPRRLPMIFSTNIIEEDNILVARAVFCSSKARFVLDSNVEAPKANCNYQRLATAEPVIGHFEGKISENQQHHGSTR